MNISFSKLIEKNQSKFVAKTVVCFRGFGVSVSLHFDV